MLESELVVDVVDVRRRRRRSVSERRLIVEETLELGTSVARVAQRYGVNANQVFQWRRLYREGHLGAPTQSGMKLLPVSLVEGEEAAHPARSTASAGSILVELAGGVRISLEGNVDAAIVRAVLVSLRA